MSNRPSSADKYSHLEEAPTPALVRNAKLLESRKFERMGQDRHYFKKIKKILADRGEKQFDEESSLTVIDSVLEGEKGYMMNYKNGWSFYLGKEHGIEPKAGDKVTSYGSGSVYRGLEINGQEAYYRTPEEQDVFNAKIRAEWEAERAVDEAKHQKTVGEKIEAIAADPFEFSDEGGPEWEKIMEINTDELSFGVIQFAHRWAKLMDREIAAGRSIFQMAREISNEADLWGMTNRTYAIAIAVLAATWKHGKELERWHELNPLV